MAYAFTSRLKLSIPDPAHYFPALAAQGILLDPAERRARILAQVQAIAAEVGGATPGRSRPAG